MNYLYASSRLTWVTALIAMSLLTGCARMQLTPPSASMDNIQAARASGLQSAAVGEFTLAPDAPKSIDLSVTIRASIYSSPYSDSLAKYLQETLRIELASAGLLDAMASTMITGLLTESDVNAGNPTGSAKLGARFVVTRNGQSIFDKALQVNEEWPSSFLGSIAIPAARNNYASLYRKLVNKLLTDQDFVRAMKAS